MNLALLGGFGNKALPAGWARETAVALLGSGELDLRQSPPGDGASLTAVAVFGSIDVVVPEATTVDLSGFSLLGSRDVAPALGDRAPGDGPAIRVRAVAIFGSVDVMTES